MLQIRLTLIFGIFLILNACVILTPSFVESDWAVLSPTNVSDLNLIDHLKLSTSEIRCYQTVWSPDGKFLAVSSSKGVFLVDSTTLQVTSILEEGQNVVSVAISPNGKSLALAILQGEWGADICGMTIVSVFDVFSQTVVKTLKFSECDRATFLAFAQNGDELVVVLSDLEVNRIQIWNTITWDLKRDIRVGAGVLWNASPDNSKLTFSPVGLGITFIDIESGDKTYYEGSHTSSKAISLNELFALGSFSLIENNSYLQVGNVTTFDEIWSVELTNECIRISSTTFAPHNSLIATGCSSDWKGVEGSIRLYNSSTGDVLVEVPGNFLLNHGLAFSPKGNILAVTSPTGEVFFWGVPADPR
jgi:hypothetical protein